MTLTTSERNQIRKLEERLGKIEGDMKKVLNLSIGIAIGVGIGAIVFGIMSIKEFLQIVK